MELDFVEQYKVILDRKGISIADIAEKMGITRQSLSQRLQRGNMREKEMDQLTKIIGCKVEIRIIND